MRREQKKPTTRIAAKACAAPAPIMPGSTARKWRGTPRGSAPCCFRQRSSRDIVGVSILFTPRGLYLALTNGTRTSGLCVKGGLSPTSIDDILEPSVRPCSLTQGNGSTNVDKVRLHEGPRRPPGRCTSEAVKRSHAGAAVNRIIGLCGYDPLVSMTLKHVRIRTAEGQVSALVDVKWSIPSTPPRVG